MTILYIDKLKHELDIGRKILLIAPGSSIKENKESIIKFIKDNNPIIISIHFSSQKLGITPDYLFFSNIKRLEAIENVDAKLILTSNLFDYINKSDFVFNFSKLAYHNSDNALILLLELMKIINIKELYLCGFDGFIENHTSYYSKSLSPSYDEISNKYNDNESVKRIIKHYFSDITIKTLTRSVYLDENCLI